MSDDELQITTADMLEIVAGGGNGVEYVDVCGLIETAAKELREKDDEITRLRAENEKLRGLLREAHVKMDENKLWVNLRRRIANTLFDE